MSPVLRESPLVLIALLFPATTAAQVTVVDLKTPLAPEALPYALPEAYLLALLVGTVGALLMVVMRSLLRHATTLRTDLEAVI